MQHIDVGGYSFGRLIRLAVSYGLVRDYRTTPRHTELHMAGGEVLTFEPEEARIFLMGLIRGYSRAREQS